MGKFTKNELSNADGVAYLRMLWIQHPIHEINLQIR